MLQESYEYVCSLVLQRIIPTSFTSSWPSVLYLFVISFSFRSCWVKWEITNFRSAYSWSLLFTNWPLIIANVGVTLWCNAFLMKPSFLQLFLKWFGVAKGKSMYENEMYMQIVGNWKLQNIWKLSLSISLHILRLNFW